MQEIPGSQAPAVRPVPSEATTLSPDEPDAGAETSTPTDCGARTAAVDLKHFIQQLARHRPDGTPTAGGYRRTAFVVEDGPRPVGDRALDPIGWIDGIQARCLAGRVAGHRDITLVYCSAGAVRGRDLLNVEEDLAALCSAADAAEVRRAGDDVPIVALPDLLPWDLALSTDTWIDETRRRLERQALEAAPARRDGFVMVDGSLPTDTTRFNDAVGVIKGAADTPWLTDPSGLPQEAGWRSPALRLPAARVGERDRLTAFLRLRTATSAHPWSYSLIRVECFLDAGLEALDAACALAMKHRQPPTSNDPRRDTHLLGFAKAEAVLRARMPVVISQLS